MVVAAFPRSNACIASVHAVGRQQWCADTLATQCSRVQHALPLPCHDLVPLDQRLKRASVAACTPHSAAAPSPAEIGAFLSKIDLESLVAFVVAADSAASAAADMVNHDGSEDEGQEGSLAEARHATSQQGQRAAVHTTWQCSATFTFGHAFQSLVHVACLRGRFHAPLCILYAVVHVAWMRGLRIGMAWYGAGGGGAWRVAFEATRLMVGVGGQR